MKYDFKSLMAIASKNYPDEVLTTFIDKDGKFIDHVLHGDRLAMHIANATASSRTWSALSRSSSA